MIREKLIFELQQTPFILISSPICKCSGNVLHKLALSTKKVEHTYIQLTHLKNKRRLQEPTMNSSFELIDRSGHIEKLYIGK